MRILTFLNIERAYSFVCTVLINCLCNSILLCVCLFHLFIMIVVVLAGMIRSRFVVSHPQCHFDLCTSFNVFFFCIYFPKKCICRFIFHVGHRFFFVAVRNPIAICAAQCMHVLIFDCEVLIKWFVSREIDTFEMK